ncbi:MAG: type II toxin-antitoxin system VapC family toxin [Pirellulales bacterium]
MADKAKVYVETTVISYLTSQPSAKVVTAAHQEITKEWWETRRSAFEVFVSELVRQEAAEGDLLAAAKRLEIIDSLPLLLVTPHANRLAAVLSRALRLPTRASADAAHIALAVVNGMDYLISWNCRHIANAHLRSKIDAVCESFGYATPGICTPEELLEGPEP